MEGLKIHPAVELIPDHDWKGETWGLYWPDLEEFNELLTEAKERKHYEERKEYPPAEETASSSSVEVKVCPKPKAKTPPPAPVKKLEPPPPPKAIPVFDTPMREQTENKWDWVRSKTDSARRARFSLSVYWG